jgi:hypothetical protein
VAGGVFVSEIHGGEKQNWAVRRSESRIADGAVPPWLQGIAAGRASSRVFYEVMR